MSVELVTIYSGVIASGASTISFDLTKSWDKIYAFVQTMSTNAALDVYGSVDGTNFYPMFATVQTFTTMYGYQSQVIGTAVAGGISPVYCYTRYVQLRASAVVSGGVNISLICND